MMQNPNEEPLSVFDMLKIGVGPSSSHTMGPWRAGQRFLVQLQETYLLDKVQKIEVFLYGSLAKTGKGHGTDIAVLLGLSGEDPVTMDTQSITPKINFIKEKSMISLQDIHKIYFSYTENLHFCYDKTLPFHPNGLSFIAYIQPENSLSKDSLITFEQTYYSVGGGFIVQETTENTETVDNLIKLPYPIRTAADALHWAKTIKGNVSDVVWENEKVWNTEDNIKKKILRIWETMRDCIYKGVHTQGELPGGLKVIRRAQKMHAHLLASYNQENTENNDKKNADNHTNTPISPLFQNQEEWISLIKKDGNSFSKILRWVSCFALAVNEENAAFGRVVTAPTNGAAGVIPAVLMYYICFTENPTEDGIIKFLMTASEIGCIFKKGATISAAMGGCQAEIGVSSAMAAGALTERLGGTPEQVMTAAEIAMEHHLGLTCDPVGGLVQIPCIERNSMGAMKAITATHLALETNPEQAKISLDTVVKTMWQTALDMNTKYKETAEGGLAVNIPISVAEC